MLSRPDGRPSPHPPPSALPAVSGQPLTPQPPCSREPRQSGARPTPPPGRSPPRRLPIPPRWRPGRRRTPTRWPKRSRPPAPRQWRCPYPAPPSYADPQLDAVTVKALVSLTGGGGWARPRPRSPPRAAPDPAGPPSAPATSRPEGLGVGEGGVSCWSVGATAGREEEVQCARWGRSQSSLTPVSGVQKGDMLKPSVTLPPCHTPSPDTSKHGRSLKGETSNLPQTSLILDPFNSSFGEMKAEFFRADASIRTASLLNCLTSQKSVILIVLCGPK